MQIQINTDNHITGSVALTEEVQSVIESSLANFDDRITRVEVQLSDESSSAKVGENDKRCLLEARLAGLEPISASHQAASIALALDGAVEKLERALQRKLGRQENPRSRTSFSGDSSL